jgi:predicted HAD superfamily hydrolase
MLDEKQFLIDAFSKNFKDFKENKIVIYGIGKSTQYILEHFSEYNFIGLMDEARTGEAIYDKKIVSKEQVLELGVDTIIIAALKANIPIIFRRIYEFCKKYSIQVYDINGNNLMIKNYDIKNFDKYKNINIEILKDKILNADVVSFDIFDTLIMRKVLYPKDIFMLAGDKINVDIFAKTRAKSEMELYYNEDKNPNIHEIYDRVQKILGISNETKNHWKNMEILTEKEYLIQRKKICKIFEYAKSMDKEIFLVSDMYLPKDILSKLLNELGIKTDAEHILVSCDYQLSKSNGLFNILKSKTADKKTLHIGDNYEADILSAKKYGIDDVFHIENAIVMLADSYACDLLKYESNLYNRIVIGEFISQQLNDPFVFSKTQGKFIVESNYDMAYSFLAPVICGFFSWMVAKAKELDLEYILFGARDGYIFEEISKLLRHTIPDIPKTMYFYTSRAVAVLAGLSSDEDILQAAHTAYSGSIEQMLKSRFFLRDCLERGEYSDDEYILKHKEQIIENSKILRKNYLKYIKDLNIEQESRVGFLDFVSSGTCQKGLSNFVDFDLYGLYFARINNEARKDLAIETLFGEMHINMESYHILNNFTLFENILTSCEPTLQNFDENGIPIFMAENRTKKQMESLREIHGAILDYVQNMNINVFKNADIELLDLIFYLLCEKYSIITTDYFKSGIQIDEFVNRKFELIAVE